MNHLQNVGISKGSVESYLVPKENEGSPSCASDLFEEMKLVDLFTSASSLKAMSTTPPPEWWLMGWAWSSRSWRTSSLLWFLCQWRWGRSEGAALPRLTSLEALYWSCSSLVWFLTCFLRLLGSVYLLEQPNTSHRYGFGSLCVCSCLALSDELENFLLHWNLQWKGFSPVWDRLWIFKFSSRAKLRWQPS